MPRQTKPRWDSKRSQWIANIGEVLPCGRANTVRFPRVKEDGSPVSDRDVAWAYGWMERYRKERDTPAPVPGEGPILKAVFEEYLRDLEERRDAGRVTVRHVVVVTSHVAQISAYRLPTGERLADQPCSRLTAEDLDGMVRRLQQLGRSPHYIDGLCRTAMAAGNWAIKPHGVGRPAMLAAHPFAGFEAPTVPVSPERFVERPIAARWLVWLRRRANAHKRETQAYRFARSLLLLEWALVRTGARPGELCDLRWGDIRFGAGLTPEGHPYGRAEIPPDRWKTGGKTGKARAVYLYPPLVRVFRKLSQVPDRHRTHVFVHGRGRGGVGAGKPWDDGSRLSKTIARIRKELIVYTASVRGRIEAGDD